MYFQLKRLKVTAIAMFRIIQKIPKAATVFEIQITFNLAHAQCTMNGLSINPGDNLCALDNVISSKDLVSSTQNNYHNFDPSVRMNEL